MLGALGYLALVAGVVGPRVEPLRSKGRFAETQPYRPIQSTSAWLRAPGRDQRIFVAAARVAEDPSRPRALRQAALIVITSYVKPDLTGVVGKYDRSGATPELTFHPTRLSHGGQQEGEQIQPTRISHGDQEQGEQPVPQSLRSRVESILTGLVSTKPGALEDLARALLAEISA